MKKKGILRTRGISALFLAAAMITGTLNGCTVSTTNPQNPEETTEEETLFDSGRRVYVAGDPMDFNISEKDDFYGAVNAESLWNMSVEYGDNTAGGFNVAYSDVEAEVDTLLKRIISNKKDYPEGSPEAILKKVAEMYAAYQGNEENRAVFDDVFSKIDSASTPQELLNVSAELNYAYEVNGILQTSILTDSENTSRHVLLISQGETIGVSLQSMNEETRQAENFRNILLSSLYDQGLSKEDAESISYSIAHRFLDLSMKVDFKDLEEKGYEEYAESFTWNELETLFGDFSAEEMLRHNGLTDKEIGYLKKEGLKVVLPEVVSDFLNSIKEETLSDWKNYLKCAFMSVYSPYAPKGYTRMDQNQDTATEDQILTYLKASYPSYISPLYKAEYYTEETEKQMREMEESFRKEYPAMIREADYLTEETRELLVKKFENIKFHFGGEDYEGSLIEGINPIEDTLLKTTMHYHREFSNRVIASLSEKPNGENWQMNAQTINAYYDPYSNNIYIGTGILHKPFFDITADKATNYGGIGCVIAHELSHAFDSNGLKFDENGNYRPDWISEADRKIMEERYEAIKKHYDKYALLDIYHVNGEQTLAENMADLGGVQCVLRTFSKKEDYEKIFVNYAKIWNTLYRKDDLLWYLDEDVHSPSLVRVNAVLSCFPEFYETYDVREGDGMYLAPEERPTRW